MSKDIISSDYSSDSCEDLSQEKEDAKQYWKRLLDESQQNFREILKRDYFDNRGTDSEINQSCNEIRQYYGIS